MPESARHHRRDDYRHKSREREHSSHYTREDEKKTEEYYDRRNRTEYREERSHHDNGRNTERNSSEKERVPTVIQIGITMTLLTTKVIKDSTQKVLGPLTTSTIHNADRHFTILDIWSQGEAGICQAMEAFLNMLIIICAGVSYSTAGEYRDIASLGGLYQYYYGGANAFTGQEAERVKQLDRQFYQLKLPPYIFSMACGGALMGYACAMLALGIFRVPFRWPLTLLVEAILNGLIALGYIPAVAFYFIKLQETYNHPICKEREALYKSKGHQGFTCSLHGADIAGGLFGVLGILLFPLGAVLAIRAFRAVRELKKQRELENNQL